MRERQRLPKLKQNNTLIHLNKEINGTIELLKENGTDITVVNNLICSAATSNEAGKTVKNVRNKDSWKIKMQRQISNWRNELSILSERGIGSDNIKLNTKKRKLFHKYEVTNARGVGQLREKIR
jgi:hypothetical protein